MTTTTAPYITPIGEPSDRPFSTLGEIKTAMTNTGSHWWDKDTMRFFNSRASENVYPTPYGTFFVSSERRGYAVPRMYTVRFVAATEVQVTATYDFPDTTETHTFAYNRLAIVETSDDSYQKYASGSGAHSAAKRMQLAMLAVASEVAAHGRA